jgi:hypothetical protein
MGRRRAALGGTAFCVVGTGVVAGRVPWLRSGWRTLGRLPLRVLGASGI